MSLFGASPLTRIDARFAALRREQGKALVAYLMAGFPSLKVLPDLVKLLADCGVDLLELGIPFSDPLADGPTIQAASTWALRQGVTPRMVLKSVENLRRSQVTLPIALLTYVNPVLQYGIPGFCRDCLQSGVDGLILPDLPPEEAKELVEAAQPLGINTIFLAAPTSPMKRLRKIIESTSGFLYYVSLTGVTGARQRLPEEVRGHVAQIKRMTRIPVCVGFGISQPSQVRQVVEVADGAIVGSALLDRIGRLKRSLTPLVGFVRSLRKACRGS